MYEGRIKLTHGLISKDGMLQFLKELKSCKPVDIKPIECTEEKADTENLKPKMGSSLNASEVDLLKEKGNLKDEFSLGRASADYDDYTGRSPEKQRV